MKLSVDSEIGELECVIIHRPGKEMTRLTPETKDDLLFDDVLWLERAQEEHDAFAELLTSRGVEILYFQELLAQTLEEPEARSFLLDNVFTDEQLGEIAAPPVHAWAHEAPAEDLAEVLIAGLTKAELLERVPSASSVVLSCLDDDDLLLSPLPNHLFTRDTSAWVYRGVSINSMCRTARRRETLNYRAVYTWHPRFAETQFPIWNDGAHGPGMSIEGGDIEIIGNDAVMIGVSERTTPQGVEFLATQLFAGGIREIIAVMMSKCRSQMHLDTIMTMVDHGIFTKYSGVGMLPTLTLRPGARPGRVDVTRNDPEDMHHVIARAMGLDEVRILITPQDSRAAAREQWDD